MGNTQNTNTTEQQDENYLTQKLQVCEVQVVADLERDERIQTGRPSIYAVDLALQNLFTELSKSPALLPRQDPVARQHFSTVLHDIYQGTRAVKATNEANRGYTSLCALEADRAIIASHHAWANRQRTIILSEIERGRLLTNTVKRPLATLQHYEKVLKDVALFPPVPSMVVKKQRLHAVIKEASGNAEVTLQIQLRMRTVLKELAQTTTQTAQACVSPARPANHAPVLWVSAVQFAAYRTVLDMVVRRFAVAAVVKLAEDERSARVHKGRLADLNVEFTRIVNQQRALRQMDDEQKARVAMGAHRLVMSELVQMYNSIIADYLRHAEHQTQVTKYHFLSVCDQLLRTYHQTQALAAMSKEQTRRVTSDRYHAVLSDLTRFYNGVEADSMSDEEQIRRVSNPPSAKAVFSLTRLELLTRLTRKVNQRTALQLMKQEQEQRVSASKRAKNADTFFLKQRLHRELGDYAVCVA